MAKKKPERIKMADFNYLFNKQTAISKGFTRYYTGSPCKNGHYSARNTNDSRCIKCTKLRGLKRKAFKLIGVHNIQLVPTIGKMW